MACSEAVPFAKTGGLADMVGSLGTSLARQGVSTMLVLPAYRNVLGHELEPINLSFDVSCPDGAVRADILTAPTDSGVSVYAVRADRFFDREHLYGPPGGDYADNADRFTFFSRAVLHLLSVLDPPDVIHCHDWQTSLVAAFLGSAPDQYPRLSPTRTLLTAHNVGYQGLFDAETFARLQLAPADQWHHFEFYGRVNFLKAGVSLADRLTTVSPTYAEEIQTAEQGCGLEGVFRERSGQLVGILNGADYEVWNPESDRFIARTFSATDPGGKRDCKIDLQQRLALPEVPIPLVSMIARLVDQKGIDLVVEAIDELLAREIQLVILGTGEERYERLLADVSNRYPRQVAVCLRFDEGLAHRIEAGSDLFLMPSRYEPSGLNQLYSLRYGTIPVVRATGGLRDSVIPFDPATREGTGFVFGEYSSRALVQALDQALECYRQPDLWPDLMKNAMTQDFSVGRVAEQYVEVYQELVDRAGPDGL